MKEKQAHDAKGIWSSFGLFLCVLLTAGTALAITCQLSKPWEAPLTDTYRVRNKHPVSGASNRPHRGVDLSKAGSSDCGEVVALNDGCTYETYTSYGGYGNTLIRDCGNGVKELFAHLEDYGKPPNTYKVGTTGGSTGCHLHYEVIIDGTTVDPECVWGTGSNCPAGVGSPASKQANLCDPAQRALLKQDGQNKLNGQANSPVVKGGAAQEGGTPKPGDGQTTGEGTPPGYDGPDTDTGIEVTIPTPDEDMPDTGGGDGDKPPDENVPDEDFTEDVPTPPAGEGGESSCATDTWNAMTNQAIMQARRETAINQTYIVKPDSILTYACMEDSLKSVQEKAGPIFSETDHWKNIQVDISGRSAEYQKTKIVQVQKELGNTSLDGSIQETARAIMTDYLTQNYNHTLLGGTSNLSAGTSCDVMKQVWDAARCRNFDKNATIFLKFEELIGNDPRKFPSTMVCSDTGITQQMIDIAQNKGFQHAKFTKVNSYKNYLGPEACTLTLNTGVTVHRREAQGKTSRIVEYPDAVCSNVGCHYDKEAQKCQ